MISGRARCGPRGRCSADRRLWRARGPSRSSFAEVGFAALLGRCWLRASCELPPATPEPSSRASPKLGFDPVHAGWRGGCSLSSVATGFESDKLGSGLGSRGIRDSKDWLSDGARDWLVLGWLSGVGFLRSPLLGAHIPGALARSGQNRTGGTSLDVGASRAGSHGDALGAWRRSEGPGLGTASEDLARNGPRHICRGRPERQGGAVD